ncbi:unnamed protein product [Cuscuta epithymum]|uniref:Pectinesterase n=1 Tax=Cuscuta epithymum TaxID=186058 RepID=A0AAV0E069_9ASTE|nr:unnamed protein product [Cuscuta epithymum]
MAKIQMILTCLASFLALSFLFTVVSSNHHRDSCSRTPHPEQCEYYLRDYASENETNIFEVSKKVALDHAKKAKAYIDSLGPKCNSGREKAAWEDCVELYDDMVERINTTIDPLTKYSASDEQTWLSAALTNIDTCLNGFIEFNVIDNIYPLLSSNTSQLISNTLALSKYNSTHEDATTNKDGFPTWVKPGDRKLLQSPSPGARADIVVAIDGTGNYKKVGEAVAAAAATRRTGSKRIVIHVKAGTYTENVEIGKKLKYITMFGDGIERTIITGRRSVGGGFTTFKSATFAAVGEGFICRGIRFINTAGAANHQAVALRSGSDHSVFYQCSFEGYQDTLYVHSNRQFYRDCNIYGTVDFIFGNAAVVIQNSNIYARNPPAGTNTITAQGRKDPNQNTGISIHNSRVTGATGLSGSAKTYLGRPWKLYSRTVFMKTSLGSLIAPEGWLPWNGEFALNTLYYGEFANTGPGASTSSRVKWRGYHVITSAAEASKFTVGSFLGGTSWLPSDVPVTPGL